MLRYHKIGIFSATLPMKKLSLRLIALALIPCLIGAPVMPAAFSSRAGVGIENENGFPLFFERQALSLPSLAGSHLKEPLGRVTFARRFTI